MYAAGLFQACAGALLVMPREAAASSTQVTLDAANWITEGKVTFEHPEGFPSGRMVLGEGRAVARNITLANGTIEYDAKLSGNLLSPA